MIQLHFIEVYILEHNMTLLGVKAQNDDGKATISFFSWQYSQPLLHL